LIDKKTCKRRFADINSFERMLVENGTLILKIYLHISKDEQRQRLLAREADPKKSWKLSVADWREREFWSDYTEAFEDAIEQCSTDAAPWRIVPANHKWFRDLAIAEAIEHTLRPYEDSWLESLKEQGEKEKKAIEEYRKGSS
jgi:polyphosphate kinase 2 (PPK2 family)